MNETVKKLKDIRSKCCVTITMKTHRTRPENEKGFGLSHAILSRFAPIRNKIEKAICGANGLCCFRFASK